VNELPETNVSIQKLNGGFVVHTQAGSQVVTSLSKALKIVRETLEDKSAPEAAE
jgi:hypothetical protein